MNDDIDVTIIQGLFVAGLMVGLVALLVFIDGEITRTVAALAIPLLGLSFATAFVVTRWRRQPRRH